MRTLIVLILFAAPAVAQQPMDLGPPLTQEKAKAFVECYGDLIDLAKKHADGDEGKSYEDLDPDDWNAAMASLTTSSAVKEFMAIIEDHGFENLTEWAHTSQRFLAAYSAIESEEGGDNLAQQVEESIAQIKANDQLSEQQKGQMITMLTEGQGMVQQMQTNAPESDKDVVRGVKDEFDRLVEQERD